LVSSELVLKRLATQQHQLQGIGLATAFNTTESVEFYKKEWPSYFS